MTQLSAMHSSASVEWYTPRAIVEAARRVLGAIDLDPASCAVANRTIKAARYFTEDDDGLVQRWSGRVFSNPPYGRDEATNKSRQGVWTRKAIAEYEHGDVTALVIVVNACVSSLWFQPLWRGSVCFPFPRLRFEDEHGRPSSNPTKDNAVAYFGSDHQAFAREFARFGRVVSPDAVPELQRVLAL